MSTSQSSTWHVVPGGDPVASTVGEATVTKFSVGPMDNNVYLIDADEDTVLIDAASEPNRILEVIGKRKISAIITTHSHADHIGGLPAVVSATGATAYCGSPDLPAISKATGVELNPVWTFDRIKCGKYSLGVIGLVGHTPGSIAIVLDVPGNPIHIFTGDSLFPDGIGKTTNPQDFNLLFTDIKTKIFESFDDDTVIHPGHGDNTTIGAERDKLTQWEERGW